MHVFVTGASGFVGGAIARALAARGDRVSAMSRSARADAVIAECGATPVRCALGRVPAEALAGVEVVVHAAAFVGPWGTREQFFSVNVDGTAQLLEVARQSGAKRFVHIGTEAALFHGQDMVDVDETAPYAKDSPFLYSASKAEAEDRVLRANDPGRGFETVSVRPRLVWGPGDTSVLAEVLRMIDSGDFMWIDGGRARTSTTHIDNLVHGVLLAMEHGRSGRAWFVTDDEVTTMREFLTAYVETQGVTPPDRSMPSSVLKPVAWLVEGVWRLFGIRRDPPITRFAASIMAADCTLDISRARRELGYEPQVSIEQGLRTMKAAAPT